MILLRLRKFILADLATCRPIVGEKWLRKSTPSGVHIFYSLSCTSANWRRTLGLLSMQTFTYTHSRGPLGWNPSLSTAFSCICAWGWTHPGNIAQPRILYIKNFFQFWQNNNVNDDIYFLGGIMMTMTIDWSGYISLYLIGLVNTPKRFTAVCWVLRR